MGDQASFTLVDAALVPVLAAVTLTGPPLSFPSASTRCRMISSLPVVDELCTHSTPYSVPDQTMSGRTCAPTAYWPAKLVRARSLATARVPSGFKRAKYTLYLAELSAAMLSR